MKARVPALLLIAVVDSAAAQLRPPADAGWMDPVTLRRAAAQPPSLAHGLSSAGRAAWESATGSVSLVEVPDYRLTTEPKRPSYALGFASETMRNWMNELGMEAGACTAPIIRLRTRIDAGDFRGTLWVHARCSLW